MYKNTSILSYFKPFTQPPRLKKRSLPEDNSEEPRAVRRSRSATPKDSQPRSGPDREGEHLGSGLHGTSSRFTSRSSSRQPPGLQDEEPTDTATPAQVSRDETSYTPSTPVPIDPMSRNADVLGSQGTSLMSSQRVVKNGEVVIRNSDDESDSDSSLEDLDDLLLLDGRKHRGEPSSPEPQSPALPLHRNAEDGRRMSTRRRIKVDKVVAPLCSALLVQPKKYRFDLESLARHRKQEEASVEDISRANAMLRSFEQEKASARGNSEAVSKKGPFDAAFIDKVMEEHGDEDEISRLKAAIQRTEALHHGKSWSFFDEQAEEPLFEQADFPVVEDDRLGPVLVETSSRQQAFLSGYVGEFVMKENLPEEILFWIMDAICLEARDDLRYSYTATLTDASKHLALVLSPERIDMLFRRIGATAAALDIEGPVIPHAASSQSIEATSRPCLLSILDLFQNLASDLGAESRVHLICTLCRLALDRSIANCCHTMSAIEDAFASLIETIPAQDLDHELQVIMTTAFKSITDATLRLRLLQSILASSHRLILIRRRLALACFFRDIRYLSQQADDTIDLKGIARYLESPRFMTSNATDYGELAAAIGILSIAIECGDPPSSPCAVEEEKAFNRDIDVLSLKIKFMFADIVDTGASHMGRTEAKEVLESLQYRLSYAVRTKPPLKQSVFGDSTVEDAVNRGMMEAFVGKGKQNASFAMPDSAQGQGESRTIAAS